VWKCPDRRAARRGSRACAQRGRGGPCAQVLVYAYVAHVYPAEARGTALGAASGIGRLDAITGPLLTGVLLTAGLAYPWGFYMFALVAALGAVAVVLVNRDPAPDERMPVTEEKADDVAHRTGH
jgi:MFS family permease